MKKAEFIERYGVEKYEQHKLLMRKYMMNRRTHKRTHTLYIKKKLEQGNRCGFCRQGEIHKVENYVFASNDGFVNWHLHHRLELTINGEFACSRKDLIRMKMYYNRPHYELIFLPAGVHGTIHCANEHEMLKIYAAVLKN